MVIQAQSWSNVTRATCSGNVRGNYYSQGHTTLTVKDPQYWDFSFDEHAKYDLPAMLEYVLSTSQNDGSLSYVGHSQGNANGLLI